MSTEPLFEITEPEKADIRLSRKNHRNSAFQTLAVAQIHTRTEKRFGVKAGLEQHMLGKLPPGEGLRRRKNELRALQVREFIEGLPGGRHDDR